MNGDKDGVLILLIVDAVLRGKSYKLGCNKMLI